MQSGLMFAMDEKIPLVTTGAAAHRVLLQPAYVLHHRPFRDTSRILELFTRDYGRVSVFARGARGGKRAAGSLLSVLQPFHRVLVSYTGKGEAGHLNAAEFDSVMTEMPAPRSLSGFYLNELLMRLFARHDSHADVFDLYDRTVNNLKIPSQDEGIALRIFEKRLLAALGYGILLDREAVSGAAVREDWIYRYVVERGVARIDGVAEGDLIFSGASLLALAREDLTVSDVRADARRLLRAALDQYLAGRALRTREVSSALRHLKHSK